MVMLAICDSEHCMNFCLVQFFYLPVWTKGMWRFFGSPLWAAEVAAGFQISLVFLLACINGAAVPVSPFEPVPSWPKANTIPQEPRQCCPF